MKTIEDIKSKIKEIDKEWREIFARKQSEEYIRNKAWIDDKLQELDIKKKALEWVIL